MRADHPAPRALVSALMPLPVAHSGPSSNSAVEFQGTIVAARTVEIAPSFDGLLHKIHFYPGQLVEKGTLLFEFRSTEKELLVESSRAKVQRAVNNKVTLRPIVATASDDAAGVAILAG